MIDLTGKSVLVTGGSRGIGRACSLMAARAGARVAVNYRVESPSANLVVEEIERAGGESFALAADVSRRDVAEMLVSETVARFGSVDVLVNNAGIWRGSPIEEMSDGEWREMLDVNLTGTFHCIREAVPHMQEAGSGRIVNIASTAGQRGEAFCSHYAATKGAIISLTKSLAAELATSGILVNCVAPGWVVTDMTRDDLLGTRGHEILKSIPLGRVDTPEEFAGAVLFLASDLATFITGEILNVNGNVLIHGSGHLSHTAGFHSDMLNGLEVVLPTGEVAKIGSCSTSPYWFGRTPLPDLAGLLLGWFGTTGVVTKLALKPYPNGPHQDVGVFVTEDPELVPEVLYRAAGVQVAEDITAWMTPKPDWAKGFQHININYAADTPEELIWKRNLIRASLKGLMSRKVGGFLPLPPPMKKNFLEAPQSTLAQFADVPAYLVVTAYQAANGLVNLVTPTSAVVMGGLAIARVDRETVEKARRMGRT